MSKKAVYRREMRLKDPEWKERENAVNRAWYAKNKIRKMAMNLDWKLRNPEKEKEQRMKDNARRREKYAMAKLLKSMSEKK